MRRSAEDERVVEIFLTPAGRALEERALAVAERAFGRTQSSMADIVRLRDELRT